MSITHRIFQIMDEKNINQITLSAETGISTSAISAWKRKNTFPTADKIPLIARCLGVSISELYGDDNYSNNMDEQCTLTSPFNNDLVWNAYKRLPEKDKLKVQVYILESAEKALSSEISQTAETIKESDKLIADIK